MSIMTVHDYNSCLNSTAENKVRIDGLLCGEKLGDSGNAGLVIANFGTFWIGFKSFRLCLDNFRLVASGFWWLRVVSESFGWSAVLVVT